MLQNHENNGRGENEMAREKWAKEDLMEEGRNLENSFLFLLNGAV